MAEEPKSFNSASLLNGIVGGLPARLSPSQAHSEAQGYGYRRWVVLLDPTDGKMYEVSVRDIRRGA